MDKHSANTATVHELARMVYFMLTLGEDFQGQWRYEQQQRQRSIAAFKRRAAALGLDINPTAMQVRKNDLRPFCFLACSIVP